MSAPASGASSSEPVKLLSIDGGGIRGLSALVLLEQLMDLSNEHRRKLEMPLLEPWQMFDMIGGTSTGGLIAIMLGRLRLSIPECKKAYMDLSEKAFTPKNFISRQIGVATVGSKFKTESLEDAIKSLIGDDWESKLLKDDNTACKVFVVSHLQDYTTHAVLRSYRNFRQPKVTLETMRIWQACRATSAALTFFDSVIIDGRTYSDGGLLYNNPVQLVHGEASEVFPNREQLIISLGTGMGKPRVFEPHLFNVAKLLGDLATETERTADNFYRREDGKAAKAGQYYRFNVPDIGDVGLEEVQKLKEIQDLTEIYLAGAELGQKVNSCAVRLAGDCVTKEDSSPIQRRSGDMLFDLLRDCLRSLAFPEMDSRFHDIDTAAQGTCKWLLRHNIYIRWASCDRGLLWIKGKPGSGKSTLLRYALANIMEIPNTGEGALILSFFFHGRGSELQKTPLGLFRSLLHQLLCQVSEALTDLVATFQQRCKNVGRPSEKWQWHPRELRRLFESSLLKVLGTRPVWLFVDALDESGQKNAAKLAREFKSLLQGAPSTGTQFHICFTCRHYPILDQACQFEICLEDENGQDISTYVRAQLSVSRVLTASTIPDLVTKRAQGVFIWAYLVVDRILDLDNRGAGLKQIEDETYSIPPDLDDLYHDLIRNMDEKLASLKLIQWICFAVRPLSLDELQWAMIVDAECPHKSSQECKRSKDYMSDSDRMKRRVQTLSCGLAEVTSDTEVVQFIHQSVKDFFVEKGLSALDWPKWVIPFIYQSAKDILIEKDPSTPDDSPRIYLSTALIGLATAFVYLNFFMRGPQSFLPGHAFPLPIVLAVISAFWLYGESVANTKSNLLVGTAHYRLSRTCIRYLAMEEIGRSASQERDMTSEFPFLHYATTSWVTHTKQSDARSVPQDDLLEYFAGPLNALMERWVRIYRILEEYSDDCPPEGTSLVHVMSRYGVVGALRAILKKADQVGININAKDSNGRTPLSLAAAARHEAIMRLLLDQGAYTEVADKGGRTPLSIAAAAGHEAVVRLLLDRGAYIEATDKHYRWTPLLMAVEEGHEAVVWLLLDRGAYTEAADKGGRTPLWWAAWKGHEAVVRLLLDRGAHTEAADQWGSTPLSLAAAAGHEAIVRLLLDRGAYIEAADKEGRMPLSMAAEEGHEAVVQLLLDQGAYTEAAGKGGWTPLRWAAWKGHEAVVRLLFDRGAHTEAADQWGSTPLWWAAAAGHEAVVRLLLDQGAYTEAADKGGRTPLLMAAAAGHEAIVRLLLDRGAYIEAIDKHYRQTPLSLAAAARHESMVGLLLDWGAHSEAADKEGRTPLSMAAENRHEAIVRLLLDRGAYSKAADKKGQIPLLMAAENRHEAVVRLLSTPPTTCS